jgi:plasmid stabilization system protein ParE
VIAGILPEAEADLEEAFDHYEDERRGLGDELLEEFRRGLEKVVARPRVWQRVDARRRQYRLARFPYGIVYRIDDDAGRLRVIAFSHLSRQQGWWQCRDR